MNYRLTKKIISMLVLLTALLNVSLANAQLNGSADSSAIFSHVAGTENYCYNPSQLTGDLNNEAVKITKNSENKEAGTGSAVILPTDLQRTINIKKFNNFAYREVLTDKAYSQLNGISGYRLEDNMNMLLFTFIFMLLAWLAIIFRKEGILNIKQIINKSKVCL